MFFIVKCFISKARKKDRYHIYAHISYDTGDVLYGKCTCKARADGCCKHVAASLY